MFPCLQKEVGRGILRRTFGVVVIRAEKKEKITDPGNSLDPPAGSLPYFHFHS
jgi:hypothetical protein